MKPIILKDNTLNQPLDGFKGSCDSLRKSLDSIAGKTFSQLSESNFIVFPPIAKEADLKNDDVVLNYRVDGENLRFTTGNVMGFFAAGKDNHFQIQSRFDSGNKNYFLHYMLQKVCNVAFTPRTSVGEDSFYDFIYFLFPAYLRKAINQGVYRAYVTREYNDANVRGPIDVARHIRKNVPFNGKIAYHTREYTTDNCVTQLIRHTIEHIRSLSMGDAVLNGSDGKNRDDVSEIVAATPTYSRHDRMSVIAKNLRPVTHPYYTAYEPLRKLCLAILRHQKLSYGESNSDSINGILFDGAALWEEYLNVIMRDSEIGEKLVHPNNRTGFRRQHLFELDDGTKNRCIYPDFLMDVDSKQGKIFTAEKVLDAKYRRLDGGLDRDASFQILSYLLRFSSKKGYLLYPSGETSVKEKSYTLIQPKDSSAIVIKAIPFHVPEYNETISFQKFSEEMQTEEGDFVKKLC
ncbi:McrC family protein [Fibrobacter sp. UWH6]|uniref:McrC family protein n=1 Tax=Fibrobacter sp. (strain UWH6) TaxID=1896212 RepID=UPI00091723BD|nr:hypothetical protein [Fibrobacter sp. UWH6]SHL66079.1 5-methylcytosine-specific restriction endonuclease McrBC, regulatory subunit McrC [Fibrobacter sp. UWH6]